MVTQCGNNLSVIGVEGNFDDAQAGVKKIFTDKMYVDFLAKNNYMLSSANSINWGRLLPQVVYYFHGYFSLLKANGIKPGEQINFVVPTGNFGDILAGFYAKGMGLPINKLICATNSNHVVADFIRTGEYNCKRDFFPTISPAMDILVSSNLERLLYEASGKDSEKISNWMLRLDDTGLYSVDNNTKANIKKVFWSSWSDVPETRDAIRSVFCDYNYLIDPHTAVGIDVYDKYVISTGDMTKTIAISTASPFKFNTSVAESLLGSIAIENLNEFEILNILSAKTGVKIPEPLQNLDKKPVLHKKICGKSDMMSAVNEYLEIK
jgi:threonine synthase